MDNLIDKKAKIFIAGHKGMVGSALVRKFRKLGYKNLITVDRKELDLEDIVETKNWFSKNKPEYVVIAAAKVGGINSNNLYPVDFLLRNLKIQNNLIETSWNIGVKRLLFLGSSCIYPKYSRQPIKEEYLLSGTLEPTNEWYALAKISGIKLCQALRIQYGFDAISLMPTNLYGPGDNYNLHSSHVMPAMIRKFIEAKLTKSSNVICWGSGLPRREFLHVDDLADACYFALTSWHPPFNDSEKNLQNEELNFLNVGTGKDISIKELSSLLAEEIGFDGEVIWDKSKPDGTPRKQLDITKITKLGWTSKIKLRTGIRDTIKSFRKEILEDNIRE